MRMRSVGNYNVKGYEDRCYHCNLHHCTFTLNNGLPTKDET